MPRRYFDPGYYHVYNRGFEKMLIFRDKQDFQRFFELLIRYQEEEIFNNLQILSYCLLPNHFHFIVSNPGVELSLFMGKLQNAYGKYFNIKYKRKGALFEGRFKAKIIGSENYLEKCLLYVNFNAHKHGIIKKIEDYPWTSYHQLSQKQKNKYNHDLILDELEY